MAEAIRLTAVDDRDVTAAVVSEPTKRALIWAFLADLFADQPTHETVATYRRGPGATWLAELGENPELGTSVRAAIDVLSSVDDDDALTARIATAYALLFLGVGGSATVAPYESAYRDDGRLFGTPVPEMESLLREARLSLDIRSAEPADHLSVELALMSHLVFAGDPASAAMLSRIRGWVPAFCADCLERDRSGFWAGIASVLAAWIAADTKLSMMQEDRTVEDRKI